MINECTRFVNDSDKAKKSVEKELAKRTEEIEMLKSENQNVEKLKAENKASIECLNETVKTLTEQIKSLNEEIQTEKSKVLVLTSSGKFNENTKRQLTNSENLLKKAQEERDELKGIILKKNLEYKLNE